MFESDSFESMSWTELVDNLVQMIGVMFDMCLVSFSQHIIELLSLVLIGLLDMYLVEASKFGEMAPFLKYTAKRGSHWASGLSKVIPFLLQAARNL